MKPNLLPSVCASLCEMGERVDGAYLSLGTVAPAARPSRTVAPRP